ncbi:DnaA ATPase domain-containing protein [Candidatus Avelusimicrobium aviculae]|uniref:DnaA ATPase domain-containing protein n=1 Tax=Candidatus Avelusimicrobium aviculae TaxID=3416206 RepID=UPI003D0D884D
MINNWDIISHIDPQTKSLLYSLVTDGTEHDARLIAKKLEGYAQPPVPAVAPFVYQFDLPSDMDEGMLDKIRTAVAEGVAQTNKVNQFVPGGVLGEPLFNQEVTKEDKDFPTFLTLDPSASFFQPQDSQSDGKENKERRSINLENAADLKLEQQTLQTPDVSVKDTPQPPVPSAPRQEQTQEEKFPTSPESAEPWPAASAPQPPQPAAPAEQEELLREEAPSQEALQEETQTGNPINDKDMLIKDMEGTLLDQMPLEDIFEARTKYDMFLDVNDPQANQQAAQLREQRIDNLADGKDSLEETFNVFEQKLREETNFMDVNDISELERIPRKKQEISLTQISSHNVDQSKTPKEVKPEDSLPPDAPDNDSLKLHGRVAQEGEGTIQIPQEIPTVSNVPPAAPQTQTGNTLKLNRREDTSMQSVSFNQVQNVPEQGFQDQPGGKQLPDEVELLNTVPPVPGATVRHFNATQHPRPPQSAQPEGDLPEITIREKIDSLDKTFNLETTMNTEVLRRTFQQTLSGTTPPAEAQEKPAQPAPKQTQAPAPAPKEIKQEKAAPLPEQKTAKQPEKQENLQQIPVSPKQTFRIRLKKAPAKETPTKNLQNDKKAEQHMEENNEEKTTFRIRRKITAPQPQAPQAPAQPRIPAQPAPQRPAEQQPRIPAQPQTAPAQQPQPGMSLGPNSSGSKIEKTKTIDHSIELPLSELKKHNWPLEVPLVPTFTLENMVISVNRFAHATAISVIDSPGKLYNPLVLYGPTGTGKTHFLNAIGYAMSQKMGQENIFMTNGVRFSRGIQRYVMEGNIEKFEKFMDSVQVLLIDDIHLVAVNEQNRVYISKLLNKFLREQKQIVITSKYPPESLAKLEELINFKLDSGWISELKTAQGPAHFKIVKKMLSDNGVDLTDNQVESFFGAPNMTLSTVSRSIRRIKVLENVIFPGLPNVDRSQAMILEKLLATKGEDKDSMVWKREIDEITTLPPFGKGEWGRIGFFYPHNNSQMMNWMVYALSERAKELGVEGSFEIAVRSSYATENIISSAFKIANLCDNKKLKGAVILGPSVQTCDPSVRENFYDILTHMLEVMLIRCGIINMEDVKLPSTYVKLISELLR